MPQASANFTLKKISDNGNAHYVDEAQGDPTMKEFVAAPGFLGLSTFPQRINLLADTETKNYPA